MELYDAWFKAEVDCYLNTERFAEPVLKGAPVRA